MRVAGRPLELWFEATTGGGEAAGATRPIWDPISGAFVDARVIPQGAMAVGTAVAGPLIVEQRETTAVIGARDRATVDEFGNLRIAVTV